MKISLVRALLAASLALGISACGDDTGSGGAGGDSAGGSPGAGGNGGDPGTGGDPSTGGTPAAGGGGAGEGGGAEQASIELTIEPTTMAAGDTVTGTIVVTNFTLEAPQGQPNEEGHGHFHLYLDGATGGNYLLNGQASPIQITIPANTAPGKHTLRLSVSDNAHVELDPSVEDIVEITVTE